MSKFVSECKNKRKCCIIVSPFNFSVLMLFPSSTNSVNTQINAREVFFTHRTSVVENFQEQNMSTFVQWTNKKVKFTVLIMDSNV
jgi:hypothetical protein